MQLVYPCSYCQQTVRATVSPNSEFVSCEHCGSQRTVHRSFDANGKPEVCLLCGCHDLWRQKDFPPQLGLTIVGIGAVASSIAWSFYLPEIAIAILMGFALFDLVLYAVMKDVLVCYRCGARHRHIEKMDEHPRFNLEVAERYRQESLRLEKSQKQIP